MKRLYEHHNYINKDTYYISNAIIREYDMSEAGYNIIKKREILEKDIIDKLETRTKKERTIIIGKMMLISSDLSTKLMEGFIEERKLFFEANNIEDEEVLSIKKDAIFLINRLVDHTEFDNVKYKLKNKYSSYMNINDIEIYYSCWNDKLDIKGVKNMDDHPLFQEIKNIIKLKENKVNENIIFIELDTLRKNYINKELPYECYREINYEGKFKFNKYLIENIDESMIDNIDITFNYNNIIIPLISLLI